MPVVHSKIRFETKKEGDMKDITSLVNQEISKSNLREGIANVFVPGSTGAIVTVEFEPGLLEDLPAALERIFPKDHYYKHQEMWHDGNGHSHVKASVLGPSLTVPFSKSSLVLGRWQQIAFIELDARPRSRSVVISMVGE